MTPETRLLLANCAGSFLLLLAFIFMAFLTVAAFMLFRGLQQVRRAAPERIGVAAGLASSAAARTRETATAVVSPQVRLASAWAGVRAGARALLSGPLDGSIAEHDDGPTPPLRVDTGAELAPDGDPPPVAD